MAHKYEHISTGNGFSVLNGSTTTQVIDQTGAWVGGGGLTTFIGLTDTPANYTAAANKILKVNNGATAVEFVDVSGDVDMNATGVFSLSAGAIVNADVNATAAIAQSKLALTTGSIPLGTAGVGAALDMSGDGEILIGDGATAAAQAITGDVTLLNTGATTVTDLTISSEAQGDVLYFNGSNWVRLGAGTDGQFLMTQGAAANPKWDNAVVGTADKLSSPFTLEGGTNDPATTVTAQTSSAAALTIPDLAGVAQEWMFTKVQQTVLNKVLDDATVVFGDTADTTKVLKTSLGGATTAKTMTLVSSHTDDRSLTLPDATDTLVGKDTTDTLTNKTATALKIATTDGIFDAGGDELLIFIEDTTPVNYLTITSADTGVNPILAAAGSDANVGLTLSPKGTGNVSLTDGTDVTKVLDVELNGATTAKTMTITASHTDDRALTLPDATDTLVGKATTDTLTNKTIDADGTGNAISNINGDELDSIAGTAGTYGVPIIIPVPNAGAATITVFNANFPWKARVIDAWAFNTQAGNAGNWKIDDGTNDITSTVAYGASDTTLSRADTIDDDNYEIAANGTLRVINSNAADTSVLYIKVLRVD